MSRGRPHRRGTRDIIAWFPRPYLAWVCDRRTSRRCRLRTAYSLDLFGCGSFWLVAGFRGWGGVRGGCGPVGGLGVVSGRAGCGGRGAWSGPSGQCGRGGLAYLFVRPLVSPGSRSQGTAQIAVKLSFRGEGALVHIPTDHALAVAFRHERRTISAFPIIHARASPGPAETVSCSHHHTDESARAATDSSPRSPVLIDIN